MYLILVLWLLIGLITWFYEIFKGPRSELPIMVEDFILIPVFCLSGPISALVLLFYDA